MRYVAAYLLAVLGGNKNPSNSDLEKILGAVGLEVDCERLSKVIILKFLQGMCVTFLYPGCFRTKGQRCQ